MRKRVTQWVYDHGFKGYCHRCDEIRWFWRKCQHRPRWWRG